MDTEDVFMKWGNTLFLAFGVIFLLGIGKVLWQSSYFMQEEVSDGFFLGNNVRKIEINAQNRKIVLIKKNIWELKEPFSWPANIFAIQSFFQKLESFKLKTPCGIRISLDVNGAPQLLLQDSEMEADYIDSASSWNHFLEPIFWCYRGIIPLSFRGINCIELDYSLGPMKFVLEQNKSDQWFFLGPIHIEADNGHVGKFLRDIIDAEIVPEYLQSENDMANEIPELGFSPEVTITLRNDEKQKLTIHLGKTHENSDGQLFRYAWLADPKVYFKFLEKDVLDRPIQILCTHYLFPKINAISVNYNEKKLFLSCDETGHWNSLGVKDAKHPLQILEHFDEKPLLLYLSLVRPIDILPNSLMNNMSSEEDSILIEVNASEKFTLSRIDGKMYIFPAEKDYGIEVSADLSQKIKEIIDAF